MGKYAVLGITCLGLVVMVGMMGRGNAPRRESPFEWEKWWRMSAAETDPFLTECRHVYLDTGSGRGTRVRALFEPFPAAPDIALRFDELFGPITERRETVCAYVVEPDSVFSSHLAALERCYRSRGWRVRVLAPRLASDSDDDFSPLQKPGKVEHVRTLDLARFVNNHVARRRFTLTKHPRREPTALLALPHDDHHRVLSNLLFRGALCHVDFLLLTPHQSSSRNAKRLKHVLDDLIHSGFGCFHRAKQLTSTLLDLPPVPVDIEPPLPCLF